MKTTAEMIEVMQAFERGEEVEVYSRMSGDWMPASKPSWDWSNADYRIKPREPRVIWVNEYKDKFYSYATEDDARISVGGGIFRTAVKYIEVIE